jgi:hypothetical protein
MEVAGVLEGRVSHNNNQIFAPGQGGTLGERGPRNQRNPQPQGLGNTHKEPVSVTALEEVLNRTQKQ